MGEAKRRKTKGERRKEEARRCVEELNNTYDNKYKIIVTSIRTAVNIQGLAKGSPSATLAL
jgi:hypothetical protein